MTNMKNILVLPGSQWQVPIVKKIKSMGYGVIAVNPYTDSPTFAFSDTCIQSDIFKQDNYLEQVRTMQPVAVLSDECDIATELVADLANKLGVRSQTVPMAQLYTNKVKMREFLQAHNLPCPARFAHARHGRQHIHAHREGRSPVEQYPHRSDHRYRQL